MDAPDTRTRLLRTAERLFAERGIEAVSLREIHAAAGQRNKSAIQYHFGSRAALVAAIFEKRMPAVDRRRHQLLDAALAHPEPPGLHELVAAIVYPLAEAIDGREGGSHYVRFLAQLEHDPQGWVLETFRGRLDGGARRALREIRERLPEVPPRLLTQRFRDVVSYYVRALGERERRIARASRQRRTEPPALERAAGARGSAGELPLPLFVSNLVDSIVGMLTAEVSDATRAELRRRGARRLA